MSAALVKELRERTGLGLLECKRALKEAANDIDAAIEALRKSSGMKAAKKAGRIAADGVVTTRIAEDGSFGVLVEVNSETDFVARDENFLGFVGSVADALYENRSADVEALKSGPLDEAREALVQKIGENIGIRRASMVTAESGVVGSYVHGNNRIAVLVELRGGDQDLARDVAMHVAAVNPQVVSPSDMPEALLEQERDIFTAQAQESGKPAEIIEKMIGGRIKKYLAENSLSEQAFVKDPDVTVGQLVKSAGAEVISFSRFEVGEGIEVDKVDFADEVAAQLKG
ncbi:MAG: translation elongation factor Ts [Luminiphilus sp.]|jgi:elongation factor Ts|nr:translation elongation factor Ts [Luminiphilus sp.]MDG1460954.1 translation elongation factor Ts [Luminiphilus sp.]